MAVEFVKYTGSYPCLCSGVLTVKIDGTEYTFGVDTSLPMKKMLEFIDSEDYLPKFWTSGGGVYFDNDYNEDVRSAPWELMENELPDKFKKYGQELIDVFNQNVPHGCCGGCV